MAVTIASTYCAYPRGRPSWVGLGVRRQSPIPVLIGLNVEKLRWSRPTRYRYTKPPPEYDGQTDLRKDTNYLGVRSRSPSAFATMCFSLRDDRTMNFLQFSLRKPRDEIFVSLSLVPRFQRPRYYPGTGDIITDHDIMSRQRDLAPRDNEKIPMSTRGFRLVMGRSLISRKLLTAFIICRRNCHLCLCTEICTAAYRKKIFLMTEFKLTEQKWRQLNLIFYRTSAGHDIVFTKSVCPSVTIWYCI